MAMVVDIPRHPSQALAVPGAGHLLRVALLVAHGSWSSGPRPRPCGCASLVVPWFAAGPRISAAWSAGPRRDRMRPGPVGGTELLRLLQARPTYPSMSIGDAVELTIGHGVADRQSGLLRDFGEALPCDVAQHAHVVRNFVFSCGLPAVPSSSRGVARTGRPWRRLRRA